MDINRNFKLPKLIKPKLIFVGKGNNQKLIKSIFENNPEFQVVDNITKKDTIFF